MKVTVVYNLLMTPRLRVVREGDCCLRSVYDPKAEGGQ